MIAGKKSRPVQRRRSPHAPPEPARDLDGMLKRLHLPTVRRLHQELATRAEAEGISYHTFLETLVAEEIAHRSETRLTRAVRAARFPFLRTIEDFNFTFQTALKLQMLGSYLGPELVTEGRSAIFSGPSGTGKIAPLHRHRLPRDPARLRGTLCECRWLDRSSLARRHEGAPGHRARTLPPSPCARDRRTRISLPRHRRRECALSRRERPVLETAADAAHHEQTAGGLGRRAA